MTHTTRFIAGIVGILTVILSGNLFGDQLNELFLKLPGIDKVLHVVAYAVVVVVIHTLAGRLSLSANARAALAAIAGGLLAIVDESAQRLVAARSVEQMDLVANAAGIILGWTAARRPRRWIAGAAVVFAVGAGSWVTWTTHVKLVEYTRGLAYERQHDFVRAREHFLRALDGGLQTAGLYNELAWSQIEAGVGRPQDAVEFAHRARQMKPGDVDILDTYGWALLHAGRTAEALEHLEKVYAAKPEMFCINYHLAAAYLASGDRDKAAYHFKRQIERRGTREATLAQAALVRLGAAAADESR